MKTLPISAIVPTLDRCASLKQMLHSLALQSCQPFEMIVADASMDHSTQFLCQSSIEGLATVIRYVRAEEVGAACQRELALTRLASQPFVLFVDDDVLFKPGCIQKLWEGMSSDAQIGGVGSMIVNQRYERSGFISRTLFCILNGQTEKTYAGKCIGPGLNILPQDAEYLSELVEVEWLNTTCTLYRKEALPDPVFDAHFTGYSLMEDLALSLKVGRRWRLANARTARVFHNSQTADYKKDVAALSKMELVNRHYVMTEILERKQLKDYAKLALLEAFNVITPLVSLNAWTALPSVIYGKLRAIRELAAGRSEPAQHRIQKEAQTTRPQIEAAPR